MGVTVATTRVAATIDTAPYTQDITTTDMGGLTPKAALFIITSGVTDGTAAAHAEMGIGAATGASNEWAVTSQGEDAVTTTNTDSAVESDHCVEILLTSGAVDGSAEFSAFITDGVRINWTNAPAGAYLLTVVLFGGTSLSAHANNLQLANTVDNDIDVTDPGFEPHLVITACSPRSNVDEAIATFRISAGVAHNDTASGITQRAWCYNQNNAGAAAKATAQVSDTYSCLEVGTGNAALDWGLDLNTFDSSGFTASARIRGANNTDICYLALALADEADGWVGTVDAPNATGDDAQTGPGFEPQIVMQGMTMLEALDTANTTSLAGTIGIGVFDADDEFANSASSEDEAATTNAQSLSDNTAVELPDDDGAAGLTASFSSFDATGWTLNYSAVEAAAKKFWAFAIKVDAVGGDPDPIAIRTQIPGTVGMAPSRDSVVRLDG